MDPTGCGIFLRCCECKRTGLQTEKDTLREKEIDEVVVVAYGKAKRNSYTGSVATISSDKINNRPVTNITKALEGQVPGIQTTTSSGQPGAVATIRIRVLVR